MAEAGFSHPKLAAVPTCKAGKEGVCIGARSVEASDEDSTLTTASQTPSSTEAHDCSGRRMRFYEGADDQKIPQSFGNIPKVSRSCKSQQCTQHVHTSPPQKATMALTEGDVQCLEVQPEKPSMVAGWQDTTSKDSKADAIECLLPTSHEGPKEPYPCNKTTPLPFRGEREKTENFKPRNLACELSEVACLQQLVEQYRHRRSVFGKNCSQRYEKVVEATWRTRSTSSLWGVSGGGPSLKLLPEQASRKGAEGDAAADLTSSSGEEVSSRGATESSASCEGGYGSNLSKSTSGRRAKSRSFPYRQFHVHHYLPEPENKVGLLTHPTPAQFNKYPKARGVWFDPHRNLVRTCWKENGKAKTMGFPVNKFGLEEARTLAVEYHYYKCPTDPLPDDLSSIVPRKSPHAYGWC